MKSRFLRTLLLSVFVAAFCVNAVAKDFVLVIDAGHGGKDVGAVGDYAMEKDVNLGVALKFGELVKKHCKNVKVVYTRDADFFVSLQDRANIANKAKGDLFVSIHTNSVDKNRQAAIRSLGRKHIHWDCIGLMKTLRWLSARIR